MQGKAIAIQRKPILSPDSTDNFDNSAFPMSGTDFAEEKFLSFQAANNIFTTAANLINIKNKALYLLQNTVLYQIRQLIYF